MLRFLVLQIITVFEKFIKNREKTKNKLRTIYPKNHECLKNNKPGVQFTGSYKKDCSALCQNKFLYIPLIECSSIKFQLLYNSSITLKNNRIQFKDSLLNFTLKLFTLFQTKASRG